VVVDGVVVAGCGHCGGSGKETARGGRWLSQVVVAGCRRWREGRWGAASRLPLSGVVAGGDQDKVSGERRDSRR